MNTKELGKQGEQIAIDYLRKSGYKILEKNFRNRFGEIDIVAKEKGTFCFIEVKTRSNLNFGVPKESVTISKQRRLNKIALSYLKKYNLLDTPARFDLVSVLISQQQIKVELLKNAFFVDQ